PLLDGATVSFDCRISHSRQCRHPRHLYCEVLACGFTATAVCSVTDEPPTLLVCLNRSASAHPIVTANGQLCVNTLAGAQRDLSNLFGGKTPMAERFAAAQWSTGVTGSPLLDGATVSFDCRISHSRQCRHPRHLYCEVLAC
uniref:flavin reductase n=1 Tax=Vibrio cholerae TaxID=666 RepID=UPI001C3D943C